MGSLDKTRKEKNEVAISTPPGSLLKKLPFLKKKKLSVIALGFPGGSVVKNLPAMQEMQVRSLDQEDSLEKEMATHSSILAWEIPWTEELAGLQSMGLQKSQTQHSH